MRGTLLGGPAQDKPAAPLATVPLTFLAPLVALGLALVAVAAVDLGLAWYPPRFGYQEWEFGTASRTFDGLALGTIGLVLLTVGAVASRGKRRLLALVIVHVLALFVLLAVAGLYALNAPVALARVPLEARQLLTHAVIRTSLFILFYLPLYGWLALFTWRQYRAVHQGAGL